MNIWIYRSCVLADTHFAWAECLTKDLNKYIISYNFRNDFEMEETRESLSWKERSNFVYKSHAKFHSKSSGYTWQSLVFIHIIQLAIIQYANKLIDIKLRLIGFYDNKIDSILARTRVTDHKKPQSFRRLCETYSWQKAPLYKFSVVERRF